MASTAWNGFKLFLRVLHEAAGAFPPLDAAVGGLRALAKIYELTRFNFGWMEEMMARLDRTLALLAGRIVESKVDTSRTLTMSTYVAVLQKQSVRLQGLHRRIWISRAVMGEDDESILKGICQTIADVLQELQLEIAISVERNTKSIMQELVLQNLPRAAAAAYTAATSAAGISRDGCTDGTRVAILQDILDWARDESQLVPPLLWISGFAGQGKTTIAYSVCEHLDDEALDVSVVSFFCSRQLDSSREAFLVSTLVLKLAESSASYTVELMRALGDERDLGHQKLEVQMKKLLVEPWQRSARLREGFPATLLVIDALDEQDAGVQFARLMIRSLAEGCLPGMRAIFTSRLEAAFHDLLHESRSDALMRHLDLNEQFVDDYETLDADILRYLNTELPRHRNTRHLRRLAEASAGLFIYASTAVRLVKSDSKQPKARSEEEKHIIELTEHYSRETAGSGNRDTMLDSLYAGVVSAAMGNLTPTQKDTRMHVLLTLIVSMHTVSVKIGLLTNLAGPGLDAEVTRLVIASLHAVLYIDSENGTILCCHTSFEDYMLKVDKRLMKRTRFRVVQHCWAELIPARERDHYILPSRRPWALPEWELTARDVTYTVKMTKFYLLQARLTNASTVDTSRATYYRIVLHRTRREYLGLRESDLHRHKIGSSDVWAPSKIRAGSTLALVTTLDSHCEELGARASSYESGLTSRMRKDLTRMIAT